MRLHPLNTQLPGSVRATFRQSRLYLVLVLVILLGLLAIGIWAVAESMPGQAVARAKVGDLELAIKHFFRHLPLFAAIMGGVMLLITFFVSYFLVKAFRDENWIMKILDREIAINLRSYSNSWANPSDLVVATIGMDEIAGIASFADSFSVPGENEVVQHNDRYLQIRLRHAVPAELRAAMHRELTARPRMRRFGHMGFQSGAAGCRIRLISPTAIGVPFRTSSLLVRPGIRDAMDLLAMSVPIDEPVKRKVHWEDVDDVQFRAIAARLVLQGDLLGAEDALRKRYKLSVTEAHNMREEIQAEALEALLAGSEANSF